jgi:5-hydroxyisourate hydrolase-like protein (transthyretin family)
MTRITTHVLELAAGTPAAGIAVTLLAPDPQTAEGWAALAQEHTDADGRIGAFPELEPGPHRLAFATPGPFFGELTVTFEVEPGREHLHIPLLLSPYGMSVYRGT